MARPLKDHLAGTKLTGEMHQALKTKAASEGKSASEKLRELVEQYLKGKK